MSVGACVNVFRLRLPFFFHDPPTTVLPTLSLHDALPIFRSARVRELRIVDSTVTIDDSRIGGIDDAQRSEEHTSELQSRQYLVCRLLLEKKKKILDSSFVCVSTPVLLLA